MAFLLRFSIAFLLLNMFTKAVWSMEGLELPPVFSETNEQWLPPPNELLCPQKEEHRLVTQCIKKYLAKEEKGQANYKRFSEFINNNDTLEKTFLDFDGTSQEFLNWFFKFQNAKIDTLEKIILNLDDKSQEYLKLLLPGRASL